LIESDDICHTIRKIDCIKITLVRNIESRVVWLKNAMLTEEYRKYLDDFGLKDIDVSGIAVRNYKKGEYLCEQGCPLEHFLFVVKGRVKVFSAASNGKTLLFCYQDPVSVLGEVEFMTHAFASSSVSALTDVQCISIPYEPYRSYLMSNIAFMNRICSTLAEIVTETSINGALNILYPFEARLCAYIAMTQENGLFNEKLTDLAEFMGTSYRHLLRTLETLCKKGIVEKVQEGYIVKDALKLHTMGENYYKITALK